MAFLIGICLGIGIGLTVAMLVLLPKLEAARRTWMSVSRQMAQCEDDLSNSNDAIVSHVARNETLKRLVSTLETERELLLRKLDKIGGIARNEIAP